LDKDGSGEITVDDLIGIYNGKMHPDVKAGKKTEDDVLKEFLSTFESYSDIRGIKDGIITREEFEDYYTFISASIDND
jgi:Ca2+-binding EF-hand superfamily protein